MVTGGFTFEPEGLYGRSSSEILQTRNRLPRMRDFHRRLTHQHPKGKRCWQGCPCLIAQEHDDARRTFHMLFCEPVVARFSQSWANLKRNPTMDTKWIKGLAAANGLSAILALRRPAKLRLFLAHIWREYRELAEIGLPCRDPLKFLFEESLAVFDPHDRIVFPPILQGGGGTQIHELIHLAAVAHVFKPKCIFEFGTFTGLTTALFIVYCPQARVITLDLPLDVAKGTAGYIPGDQDLIRARRVAHYLGVLDLGGCYEQLYCDSFQFDPAPLEDCVDFAFIDGGHHYECVVNDTEKTARMIRATGIVMWHDYGGTGDFLPLTNYLEALGRGGPIFRVPGTSLAWAVGKDLKQAVSVFRAESRHVAGRQGVAAETR
jgi:hypothetical protein